MIKQGIISRSYDEIRKKYINEHAIENLTLDSTDIMNGNCERIHTSKSFKLSKQALRLNVIATPNRIPLAYQTDAAYQPDCILGFQLMRTVHINDGKTHIISADKGYYITDSNKYLLLRKNKLRLIVPKKKYKRKSKTTKSMRKHIRHSKQMANALKERITIEHTNSIIHRSFKRIDKVFDKSKYSFNGFVELAFICMIIHEEYKENQ